MKRAADKAEYRKCKIKKKRNKRLLLMIYNYLGLDLKLAIKMNLTLSFVISCVSPKYNHLLEYIRSVSEL